MPVQSHVSLPGSRRSLLPGSRVMGPARADEDVEITVKVQRKAKLPPLEARPAKPLSRAESAVMG
jgi:kumamolisin